MPEQAEKINYVVELAEHNPSGTAAKIDALSDEDRRGSKVINFLKRAAQRRQVVDDEKLTCFTKTDNLHFFLEKSCE